MMEDHARHARTRRVREEPPVPAERPAERRAPVADPAEPEVEPPAVPRPREVDRSRPPQRARGSTPDPEPSDPSADRAVAHAAGYRRS